MVNTFMTSTDFSESAANLDRSRLNKQILEAKQILNVIGDLLYLSKIFNVSVPSDSSFLYSWSRNIMKLYKETKHYIFKHQGKIEWISRKNKPRKLSNKTTYFETATSYINDDIVVTTYIKDKNTKKILICDVVWPKYSIILSEDKLFLLGWWSHPCVLMWVNHTTALKEYINCHITEWVKRGYKSSYSLYTIKSEIEYPEWLNDNFIRNHKAALMTKEIKRTEKEWYINIPGFIESYRYYIDMEPANPKSTSDFKHYIWPNNLKS